MSGADFPKAIDLDELRIDPIWAMQIPGSLALRRRVLPLALLDGKVHVACLDPNDRESLDAVARFTAHPVVAVLAEAESLTRALHRVIGDGRTHPKPNDPADADAAVALADDLLRAAIARRASDIHIDPMRDDVRVRLRVDGGLEEFRRLPLSALPALSSRIKVLGEMDIAERRAPQDGGFSYQYRIGPDRHQSLDIRVASLPTRFGERLSLRLLAGQNELFSLEDLGMSDSDLAKFESILDRPHGLVLLTGPTGSGKSTTLCAAMRRLTQGPALNIISVEDPIEYEIPGVAQVEVDSADKVSFSKALRSLLRHDPDVLVIGEIRDPVSLDVAIKAALTGHLVFSTLHANNAISAVTRLRDMGLAPHLIGATLRLSVAQRLVRRLCPHCRKPQRLTEADARLLGIEAGSDHCSWQPGACLYCAGRGFLGRLGLFECAAPDQNIASRISHGASETELTELFSQIGFATLRTDGAQKVINGQTTISDVLDAAADF